jgi:hypothetical protein
MLWCESDMRVGFVVTVMSRPVRNGGAYRVMLITSSFLITVNFSREGLNEKLVLLVFM